MNTFKNNKIKPIFFILNKIVCSSTFIINRSIFNNWQIKNIRNTKTEKHIKSMSLNFGPQHPAAHGVLRLIMQLNNELIEKIDIHIGLLHRGTEKLLETKSYVLGLPYFDRLDYVSMLSQEHTLCLAIETLCNTSNFSTKNAIVRSIFDEITRLLNHLLAIACHALDVGSMSSVFWSFEEREKLMEFYERVSGARMHAAFYRPNLQKNILTKNFINDLLFFLKNFFIVLNEMHNILTYNKIWKQRLIGIGVYDKNLCRITGLTGVMSRCTGIKRDLRLALNETYSFYYYINFRSYIGNNGDSFDRYLLRMNEMCESSNIINQILNKYKTTTNKKRNKGQLNLIDFIGKYKTQETDYTNNNKTMELLIKKFNTPQNDVIIKKNFGFQSIESPKGEFSVFLTTTNSNKPYKCKIRSPAYHHLQFLPKLAKNHYLADLITLIGTIDIVFGEIDR